MLRVSTNQEKIERLDLLVSRNTKVMEQEVLPDLW